ncbi:MAG: class I poly(R)-hydroxyalkanoic acid synthase [Phenylobacterium sp.]
MEQPSSSDPLFLDPVAFQEYAANVTKAALIGQQAIVESLAGSDPAAALQARSFQAPSNLLNPSRFATTDPQRWFAAQGELVDASFKIWRDTYEAALGAGKESKDKRFAGEAWRQPGFEALRQGYQAAAGWLNAVAKHTDLGDPKMNRRVQFFTKVLTDLFSPSNFLASNPEALAEAARTRGESLVRGMENFAADLKRGGGQLAISQTDMSKFEVGKNLAVSPGKVVFQNELLQLIQFSPATEQVRETPLLIATAFINKYYILDLQPANSMIKWLTEQGFTVFVTSWVNPDARHASMTFADYMAKGLLTAMDKVMEQCGTGHVNVVGYCISGTLLASTLAYLAAKGADSVVSSATFFAAQQDFTEPGDLALLVSEDSFAEIERRMDSAGGVLPGSSMAEAFNLLRANDLIFSFLVNNYLMGKQPKAFDLLFWNSDQTRIPKALGLWYLRSFYQDNLLSKGQLELVGERLDLSKVTTPVFVQSAREDHIAPAESVYRGARLFGGPTTFILAGSGHIAGVVNHPAANKYQYWSNEAQPDSFEAWKDKAVETRGSWWPIWAEWLHQRSGEMVPARDPAAGPLTVIEDAPGAYVKVMS